MIIGYSLKKITPFVPVVGSIYGFTKSCVEIYNSSSPTKAVISGVKCILVNCTPPAVKYPLLCSAALTCAGGAVLTGDPGFIVGTIDCCNSIIKK